MKFILIALVCVASTVACGPSTPTATTLAPSATPTSEPESPRAPAPTPTSTPGVPPTSASAITSPPASMDGINTQTDVYGTGADPNVITLGPKDGGQPDWPPYPGKTSMEFELAHGTPILAPVDMTFTGFNNRNARFRIGPDGDRMAPFDDLELCFESTSADWPSMAVCVYHLSSTPLLTEHNVDPACAAVEEWGDTEQAQGRVFFEYDDRTLPENRSSRLCGGLLGRVVERGQLIGYAGSVGEHSMAPFRFKVPSDAVNPTVKSGDKHLHWVQPGSFFYWQCYAPGAQFESGVLAYPFECGSYELPTEQTDTAFKYVLGG